METVKEIDQCFKVLMKQIFYYLILKSVQNDKEWSLFYCDSTLGCRVIQDFDLCKLDDFWRHSMDRKWCTITKNQVALITISHDFFCTELKLSTVTLIKVTLYGPLRNFHGNTIGSRPSSIQRGKSELSSFKKCYLLLMFIQLVWANMDITEHKHKKVC